MHKMADLHAVSFCDIRLTVSKKCLNLRIGHTMWRPLNRRSHTMWRPLNRRRLLFVTAGARPVPFSAGAVVLEGLYVRFNLVRSTVELAPSVCGPRVTLSEPYTTAGELKTGGGVVKQ